METKGNAERKRENTSDVEESVYERSDGKNSMKPPVFQLKAGPVVQMKEEFPYDGEVTGASLVSLRSSPSKDPSDPHKNTLEDLPRGTKVQVIGKSGGWLKVSGNFEGKAFVGFVSGELIQRAPNATPSNPKADEDQRKKDRANFEYYPEVKESSGWAFGNNGLFGGEEKTQTDVSNLIELGIASIANANVVNLTGDLLAQIKLDPEMIIREEKIVKDLMADERYGKESFYLTDKKVVGFGGVRWRATQEDWFSMSKDNPLAHQETWDVAGNELTWALRNATVRYWAEAKANGEIRITYRLYDTLDLSGSAGRSDDYSLISNTLGFFYHRLAGGNINLQTRATWTSER